MSDINTSVFSFFLITLLSSALVLMFHIMRALREISNQHKDLVREVESSAIVGGQIRDELEVLNSALTGANGITRRLEAIDDVAVAVQAGAESQHEALMHLGETIVMLHDQQRDASSGYLHSLGAIHEALDQQKPRVMPVMAPQMAPQSTGTPPSVADVMSSAQAQSFFQAVRDAGKARRAEEAALAAAKEEHQRLTAAVQAERERLERLATIGTTVKEAPNVDEAARSGSETPFDSVLRRANALKDPQ